MKNIILFLMCIIFVSCSNNSKVVKTNFSGFGDLLIGNYFDSIPYHSQFTKISDDVYYMANYPISKEIGNVEDVYITLYHTRIVEVSFNGDNLKIK